MRLVTLESAVLYLLHSASHVAIDKFFQKAGAALPGKRFDLFVAF